MRKTKLSLDTLQVETFETDPAAAETARGTVRAHEFTEVSSLCQGCTRSPTCDVACSTNDYEVCYVPWTRQPGCPEPE